MKIRYCEKCVMPNTKPNMNFDESICPSYNYHLEKNLKKLDGWIEKEFLKIIKGIKKRIVKTTMF